MEGHKQALAGQDTYLRRRDALAMHQTPQLCKLEVQDAVSRHQQPSWVNLPEARPANGTAHVT